MTLTKKVEEIVAELARSNPSKNEALRKAEELADHFHDVKPVPYEVPIEQALGLPSKLIK